MRLLASWLWDGDWALVTPHRMELARQAAVKQVEDRLVQLEDEVRVLDELHEATAVAAAAAAAAKRNQEGDATAALKLPAAEAEAVAAAAETAGASKSVEAAAAAKQKRKQRRIEKRERKKKKAAEEAAAVAATAATAAAGKVSPPSCQSVLTYCHGHRQPAAPDDSPGGLVRSLPTSQRRKSQ